MAKDAAWLKRELTPVLGWDASVLDDVVQTIGNSSTRAEAEEIVANFMDGNPAAKAAVDAYLASRAGPGLQPKLRDDLAQVQQQYSSSHQHGSPARATGNDSNNVSNTSQKGRANSQAATTASPTANAPTQQPSTGSPAGGKVLGMFKQGGKIRSTGGKGAGKDSLSGAAAIAAGLERQVVNCLGCGKIYDCRNTTNPDIIKFLERQGTCTFCGAAVSMSYNRAAAQQEASTGAAADGKPAASTPAAAPLSSADEAAKAFKDRLVMYDRESAKRTTVIDDQSDFFEVDTNAWLTDAERQQLREQRRIEAEAEKARQQRVAITIDLLGRRVLVADAAEAVNDSGASFRTGQDALVAAYNPKKADTTGAMWNAPVTPSVIGSNGSPAAGQPASGSNTQTTRNDGVAATALIEERVKKAAESLRNLRASACPNTSIVAPQFVKGASHDRPHSSSTTQQVSGQAHGAAAAGSSSSQPTTRSSRKAASKHLVSSARLQTDMEEEFDMFGAQVMYTDVEEALIAAEAAQPFDICPSEFRNLPPLTNLNPLPKLRNEVTDLSQLPPGLVLLRGWLSPAMQQEIVQLCRDLGMGPGGFYTPSYGGGQTMRLHMMCLGQHWEPRTHQYEPVRSSHDGATPPAIPAHLRHICGQALAAATQWAKEHQGVQLPAMDPNICLVNYYEGGGRLGMHQDKDESSASLQQGLPVVSLSLGDTADFLFNRSYDEASAQGIRLSSGDVVVFGGPSRLLYHAVQAIHGGTTPHELTTATGMRPGRLNLTFRQT